jgi:hypothetical protein
MSEEEFGRYNERFCSGDYDPRTRIMKLLAEARRAREAEKRNAKGWDNATERGRVLEAERNDARASEAALAERVRVLMEALREIAGDDPDDGCRQGHSKFAAQTLSRGKEAGK